MNTELLSLTPFFVLAGVGFFYLASLWKCFSKAHEPGWAAFIPIYNLVVMMKIAKQPLWHLLLYFVPFGAVYAYWVTADGVSKAFGKKTGFSVGMFFAPAIFIPVLAWGSSVHSGGDGAHNGGDAHLPHEELGLSSDQRRGSPGKLPSAPLKRAS